MSSLLILACLGGLLLVVLFVYAVGKGIGGDWEHSESDMTTKDLLALNPVSAVGNIIRIARESEGREVHETILGSAPTEINGGGWERVYDDPRNKIAYRRIVRKGKKK